MKFSKIALAVAATLVAGQAFAAPVTPATIQAARTAGTIQETWISGASAPTFNVFKGFKTQCDANSLAYFHSSTSTSSVRPGSSGDFGAYACTIGGVVSVAYHTVAGGSFNAYAPHVDGTSLSRIGALGSSTNPGCTLQSGNIEGSPVYRTCATVVGASASVGPTLPAGGFSDVEFALFGTGADVAAFGTETDAKVGQAFGVVVNSNLYRQLQVSQGIYASIAAANAADAAFDPVNAPNISSAQYTSIIASGSGYQTDWSPILGAAGAGKKVVLVRRVATSGTQASSNAFFLKNPCNGDPGVQGKLEPAALGDSTPGVYEVFEESGTGGVKTRLTAANTSGDFAIGVVSLENDWRRETAAASAGYRFVKVDNVHPEAGSASGPTFNTVLGTGFTNYTARKNAIDGNYGFMMELKSFVANSADAFGASLIPAITTTLAAPDNCADVSRGLLLNPLGGSACTADVSGVPATVGFPFVAKGTRFGNNCQAIQLLN